VAEYFKKNSASLVKYKQKDGTSLGISNHSFVNQGDHHKYILIKIFLSMEQEPSHELKFNGKVVGSIFIKSYTIDQYLTFGGANHFLRGVEGIIACSDFNGNSIAERNISTVNDLSIFLNDLFGIEEKDGENGSFNSTGTNDSPHSDDSGQKVTTDILVTLDRLVDILSKESENVGKNLQLVKDLVQHIKNSYPSDR
jgi:hypothetical protein